MRRALLPILFLLALPVPARGSELYLDSLTDPFPANQCLPVTHAPVIYLGQYCDGNCPPDTPVPDCGNSAIAGQLGLAGVLQNSAGDVWRVTYLLGNTAGWMGRASAELLPASHRIEAYTSDPSGSIVYLDYGSANLNLDLLALGATTLRIPVTGDISPSQPLKCTVQFLDRRVPYRYAAASNLTLTSSGEFVVSLPGIWRTGGFTFSWVDDVNISIMDCDWGYCSTPVAPRHYWIGAPRFDVSAATAVAHRSWGQLKAAYR